MEIVKGLSKKTNSSGHTVLSLHYSADPSKDAAWVEKEAQRYVDGGRNSIRWRGEMEMDFDAGSGELVFTTFSAREKDILIDPFPVDETFLLYAGLDWGTRNPVAFNVFAEGVDKQFYCIWEYHAERQPLFEVARAIRECPFYSRLQWIAGDPSMWNATVANKGGFTSIAEMMTDPEMVGANIVDKLMPAHARSDETGINVTKNMWASDRPQFQIFKSCPSIIGELRNLKYPDRTGFKNDSEKIVDKNNHHWDAWKYFRLSHPFAPKIEEKPKFGTVAYLNEVTELATSLAQQRGTSVQEEFNDIWGMNL